MVNSSALAIIVNSSVSSEGFPTNLLRFRERAESGQQRRPSRSAPGVSRGEDERMGCGVCGEETSRRGTGVARGGWADVALRPPATSSVCVWTGILI